VKARQELGHGDVEAASCGPSFHLQSEAQPPDSRL